jgi:hypothetical protein
MLKTMALVSALSLLAVAPAKAATDVTTRITTTDSSHTSLPAEVVEVQSTRRSAGSIIVGDAIGGAVLGTAAGGGVALYNRYKSGNDGTWGNWQRDLAIGAGIGLAVGLIYGGIDAATSASADRAYAATVDQRGNGFSAPVGQYGMRF